MQNDREPRNTLFDFLKNVEAQRRGNESAVFVARALFGLELVCAVRSADGNRQGVDARLADEVFDFFGAGVGVCFVRNFVFDTRENAEFAFDGDVVFVGVFDDLLGEGDVVFVGVGRAVDHNGREAEVDAGFAKFKRIAVVEVQNDRNIVAQFLGVFASALSHIAQERLVCVLARAARDLKNDRRLLFDASLNNCLHLFHIVEVKRGNRVFTDDCFFEKLARINQTEFFIGYHSYIFVKRVLNIFHQARKTQQKIAARANIFCVGARAREFLGGNQKDTPYCIPSTRASEYFPPDGLSTNWTFGWINAKRFIWYL